MLHNETRKLVVEVFEKTHNAKKSLHASEQERPRCQKKTGRTFRL